jgi:hypothetical protein
VRRAGKELTCAWSSEACHPRSSKYAELTKPTYSSAAMRHVVVDARGVGPPGRYRSRHVVESPGPIRTRTRLTCFAGCRKGFDVGLRVMVAWSGGLGMAESATWALMWGREGRPSDCPDDWLVLSGLHRSKDGHRRTGSHQRARSTARPDQVAVASLPQPAPPQPTISLVYQRSFPCG